MSMTLILGIETSCDETAAAVVADGRTIHSNVIASQIDIHQQFGGVYPEVASRQHVLSILPVIEEALIEANVHWERPSASSGQAPAALQFEPSVEPLSPSGPAQGGAEGQSLTAVAVTYGPGLAGSLLVGVNVAKAVAWGRGLPLIGINHIEAHIYANWLVQPPPPDFPLLCLVVSGGHTELILMKGHGQYQRLGGTLDDAAGEAFDKVGRLLGLSYPGGPAIQELARAGSPTAFDLPRAWLPGTYDFSFSGLKTAVLRIVQRYRPGAGGRSAFKSKAVGVPLVQTPMRELPAANLAASFQASVVDVLVEKTRRAAEEFEVKAVLLAGGVAANELLRAEMSLRSPVPVRLPPPEFCTDNAAMIASAGFFRFSGRPEGAPVGAPVGTPAGKGRQAGWDLDVVPSLRLLPTERDGLM